jgi:Na+/proline symporter/signal transduction histidine kinase
MTFNIDSAIFIGFLAVNLVVGLWYSRGVKNIREYAVGDRNFSTATITATIVATWMAGSNIAITVGETYQNGLYYIIPGLADGISFFIIAYFYAPRMAEFLGNLSVAEAMGNLYGKNARIITAISAMVIGIGNVAVQFSVCTVLLHHFLGISEAYALLMSSVIVISYSTLGGIKAVTFTDMIQFFTFGLVLPISLFWIWQSLDSNQLVLDTLTQNPIFNYQEFFNYNNPTFLNTALLFLFFIIPGLDPALFQRISMAKNTHQVSKSFTIAGFVMIVLEYGVIASTGILLLSAKGSALDADNLMIYILDNYMHGVFKGLFVIGIMAMLMSTADSYINCSAVLCVNDLCKSVGINLTEKKTLFLTRVVALSIGITGVVLSLYAKNLLDLILSTYSFYMPIVSTPLLLAIFGFRSTSRSVLIGMSAGFITVISCKIYDPELNNIIPGMLANMLFLFGSHYLLRQDGGWVGIKDDTPLNQIRLERKRKLERFIYNVRHFSFIQFCKNNTPKDESFYAYFGVLSILSIFSAIYSVPKDIYSRYETLITCLHYSVLFVSTTFITYPAWAEKFKSDAFISILWNMAMFYNLVFVNSTLFIISNFSQTLLTILIVNLVTLAILLRWQVALLIMVVGIAFSVEFYKWFNNLTQFSDDMFAQFKMIYSLIVVSSILIAFLKPKQEYIEATEQKADALEGEKAILAHKVANLDTQVKTLEVQKVRLTGDVTALGLQVRSVKDEKAKLIHEVSNLGVHVTGLEDEKARLTGRVKDLSAEVTDLSSQVGDLNEQVTHYTEQIADKDKEIDRLGQASERILNNVNHELRLPIGNVVNFSEMLQGTLGRLENNKLVKELAKEVYDNSNRVSTMILNMLDLATLAVKKVDLEKTMVNFSELVLERVRRCQKIYLHGKNIEFKLDIEPEIQISVDPNYMRQTVDNLVINSINFSKQGLITISVTKKDGEVIFTITDQGVGIPDGQLTDIFTPFMMGTNIESKTQGRGVGLALCKSAVEAHGGSIKAESDGECGAKLQFTLPFGNNQ